MVDSHLAEASPHSEDRAIKRRRFIRRASRGPWRRTTVVSTGPRLVDTRLISLTRTESGLDSPALELIGGAVRLGLRPGQDLLSRSSRNGLTMPFRRGTVENFAYEPSVRLKGHSGAPGSQSIGVPPDRGREERRDEARSSRALQFPKPLSSGAQSSIDPRLTKTEPAASGCDLGSRQVGL